jgi:signal transduction histidine kinase
MSLSTHFQDISKQIYTESEYLSAGIRLEQLALSNISPADLMREAAVLITQTLPVEYCMIWQLLDDNKYFLLMAGAGLENCPVTRVQIPVDPHSMKGFAITSLQPVVLDTIHQEKRFKTTSLNSVYAKSGICVLLGTLERPYGVMEVFSRQRQAFAKSAIDCLQSIANIIGLVLDRVRYEENWVAENQKLKKELIRAEFMTPSGHFEWDRYEVKNRLIENRERERLSLAQDLHDIPIQDLYGLLYQLDDLKEDVQGSEGGQILEEFRYTLHRVVDSLRAICRELRPPSLSPFGLEVTIRDHAEKFHDQNPEINVHLDLTPDKQILSDSLRLGLFRIYQQAMHNVARHARATEVHVRFHWDDEMIILEVEDNGRGFEVPLLWMDLVREDHFGLLGIAERVESIRGKLEIISAPGSGTLIRTLIPRY